MGATGSVYCRGLITATLSWVPNPGIPNDQPPAFIVVEESGSAIWTGDGGNCSDGLGDSEVDTTNNNWSAGPNQGVSAGNHYYCISNPGSSYTITDSPSAFGYGNLSGPDAIRGTKNVTIRPHADAGPGGGGGPGTGPPVIPCGRVTAAVSFYVSTWTPSLVLSSFVLGPGGSWNVQIGTPELASLFWMDMTGNVLTQLPSPLSCVNYMWVIPGVTFSSWNTSLTSGAVAPVTWLDEPYQPFVWADANGQCSAGETAVQPNLGLTVENNGTAIGSGAVSVLVYVWRPYSQFQPAGTVGTPGYSPTTPPYSSVASGLGTPPASPGCAMYCSVGVSDVFGYWTDGTTNYGMGGVNWCQLVDFNASALYGGVDLVSEGTGGQYVLDVTESDSAWYWSQNSGTPNNYYCTLDEKWPPRPNASFFDTPGLSLYEVGMYATTWDVDFSFETWTMYVPAGGAFVPLLLSTWSWQDGGTEPYDNPPLPGPDLGLQGAGTDAFPEWTVYTNSPG